MRSLAVLVLLFAACGSSDAADEIDSGAIDAASFDGAPAFDAGLVDAATPDASDGCHGFGFGAPVVNITQVGAIPAATGGTIPLGTYNAVAVETTGAVTGTFRGTWVFESASVLNTIEQITLSGTPPPAVPRIQSWITDGTGIMRTRNCPDTETFTNEYSVRNDNGQTFLDIQGATLRFIYQLEP